MATKTGVGRLVKARDAAGVAAALAETPALVDHRDDRGRTWLHLCCGTAPSIDVAAVLVDLGLGVSDAAFTEGEWRATPVWYAVARGRDLALARWLLERGADPDHSLFAACWNHDLAAIDLLLEFGAAIDEVAEGETPFLGAIKFSRFEEAWHLAAAGADVHWRDADGMTARDYMEKKRSPRHELARLATYG